MRLGHYMPLLLVAALAAPTNAASFFLSSSDTDPNAGLNISLDNGQTGSYWVWVNPAADGGTNNLAISGLSLDILSSDAAVTEATGADVFQGFSASGGALKRWAESGGTHFSVGSLGDHVTNLNSVGVGQQGVGNPAFITLDENVNGNYLHGRVDFMATAVGMTTLTLQEGSGQITTNDGEPPLGFAGGTITVLGSGPEAEGNPPSGSDLTMALQDAFDNRNGGPAIVPDAIMVMNNNGPIGDLNIQPPQVNRGDSFFDIFVELQPGSEEGKFDLIMDGPFNNLPPGALISGDIQIQTDGGNLDYSFSARVPEPSTVALAGLGLIGLVGFARRRK